MKKFKYLLISLFILSFINITFTEWFNTGTLDNWLKTRYINERINELIKVNKNLQLKNKELSNNYNHFNSWLEYYIKSLSLSKNWNDEKNKAYDIALNNIFNWIKWYWWILSILIVVIGVWFWLYKQNEIKNSKKEILDDIWEYKKELKGYKNELKENNKENIDLIKEQIISNLSYSTLKEEIFIKMTTSINNKIDKSFNEEREKNKFYIEDLINDEKKLKEKIENRNEEKNIEEDDWEILDQL